MKSLKELYNLSYDTSGDYGLTNWYNKLIDKFYDDLTTADACKMIRQNVLKCIAVNKVIELFLNDPYDGDFFDGGLLDILCSLDVKSFNIKHVKKIKNLLRDTQLVYMHFDWFDVEAKNKYAKNIDMMLKKIALAE